MLTRASQKPQKASPINAASFQRQTDPAQGQSQQAAPTSLSQPGTQLRSALRTSDILALQRTVGNQEVQRMLGRSEHQSSTSHKTALVLQRQVYQDLRSCLQGVVGVAPASDRFDPVLQAVFTEAEKVVPLIDFRRNDKLDRLADITYNSNQQPEYYIQYNPTKTSDQQFFVASIIHEILHASTSEHYHGKDIDQSIVWLNMHIPAHIKNMPQGNDRERTARDDAIGNEIRSQIEIVQQNLADAMDITEKDNELTSEMKKHVISRLEYADRMPDAHYDTVLVDIMTYMQLNGATSNQTYKFIRRMVKESNDRRLKKPWWGTKRVRRVDQNARWFQFWKW